METIEIPPTDIVPLESAAPGVSGLRIVMVNVVAVVEGENWILVDAGLQGSGSRILAWADEFTGSCPPAAIVLTHGHFDHVGAIETLLSTWDVAVYAHQDELPYVTGARSYPPPDPSVGGGLMARMSSLYPRGPIELGARARALPADGTVPSLPGWRWIATPGHTEGHVSLFRDADRTLIVGDAFCTTKQESFLAVMAQRPELHGPPAYFTTDWDAARESVRRLSALHPAAMVPGHGRPMKGEEASAALSELAARFDELARPEQGRYVAPPAPR
jgi:glyoxylase-like metal-dependent hydrolase (beta-lactamase superfamily II)